MRDRGIDIFLHRHVEADCLNIVYLVKAIYVFLFSSTCIYKVTLCCETFGNFEPYATGRTGDEYGFLLAMIVSNGSGKREKRTNCKDYENY